MLTKEAVQKVMDSLFVLLSLENFVSSR